MRTMKVWFLLVLVVVVLASAIWGQAERYKDNYGKVIGQIVDPETGLPINEKFIVYFDLKSEQTGTYSPMFPLAVFKGESGPGNALTTDSHGKFFAALFFGSYALWIEPVSDTSLYCRDIFPPSFTFDVYKGKITRIKKSAIIGGFLNASLYDQNGNKIDPKTTFAKNARIRIELDSKLLPGNGMTLCCSDNLMNQIIPGEYTVTVKFEYLGFLPMSKGTVVIKPKETTHINIVLDLSDKTGFEGYITDSSGKPIENAEVSFSKEDIEEWEDWVTLKTITDRQGYYRLTGMPVGLFKIVVHIGSGFEPDIDKNILIESKKGVTIIQNIQVGEDK